jgi:hypothetical protein
MSFLVEIPPDLDGPFESTEDYLEAVENAPETIKYSSHDAQYIRINTFTKKVTIVYEYHDIESETTTIEKLRVDLKYLVHIRYAGEEELYNRGE